MSPCLDWAQLPMIWLQVPPTVPTPPPPIFFSYHISLDNLISFKVCVSNCVSGQVTSGMQPGKCKRLMKSNRVHTFCDMSCFRQVCLSWFLHWALPPGYGLGLVSITRASASGKHRCLQSLEIHIHLQQEGVSQDTMGEGRLSRCEPRGTHKSCWFPEARSGNGNQVRGPPAVDGWMLLNDGPPKVLEVGVCGSLHPGRNLWLMSALSVCPLIHVPLSAPLSPLLSTSPLPFFPLVAPSPLLPSPSGCVAEEGSGM